MKVQNHQLNSISLVKKQLSLSNWRLWNLIASRLPILLRFKESTKKPDVQKTLQRAQSIWLAFLHHKVRFRAKSAWTRAMQSYLRLKALRRLRETLSKVRYLPESVTTKAQSVHRHPSPRPTTSLTTHLTQVHVTAASNHNCKPYAKLATVL